MRSYEQGDGKTRTKRQEGESKISKLERTNFMDDPRKKFLQGKEDKYAKMYKPFTSYAIYKFNKLNINLYLL